MISKKLIALILLLSFCLLSTGCDKEFYLSEKEFYSLRGQLATAAVANLTFNQLRGQRIEINFDNTVSPPRIRNSNLALFLRSNVPSLGILEGFPSYALSVDRISSEIERQFDNWLAGELRLYSGPNNTEVKIERVDAMRIQFLSNPTFTFSGDKIVFDAAMDVGVDCRIRINKSFPASVANGTHNLSITARNMQTRGEFFFYEIGGSSNLNFKMTPRPGRIDVAGLGGLIAAFTNVRTEIENTVSRSLSKPIVQDIKQQYDYFALSNCRVRDEFRCLYNQRPESSSSEIHTVFRSTDNKLYWSARRGTVWSNYWPLKAEWFINRRREVLHFAADPSITRSSSRTIELAVVSQSGGLYYSQYDNGWKSGRFLPISGSRATIAQNRFVGRPAIAATSAGNVEVVVARANGTLVHLRRSGNGNWSEPVVLRFPTGSTYRDPVIVNSVNRLFLAAVRSNGQINTMVFDLQTGLWSQSSEPRSAEAIKFAPAIAASGDRQIDMVYVGTSGQPYHRDFTLGRDNIRPNIGDSGVSFRAERAIAGNVTATPVLVATGFRQLDLIARGTDNVLYYNHFSGPRSPGGFIDGRTLTQGWSGWGDLNRNFYGTRLLANDATEDFAGVATTAGKIEFVARLRANTTQREYRLHYNNFNAMSFGRQLWKSVQWRGFQKVDELAIAGRPAIAAL